MPIENTNIRFGENFRPLRLFITELQQKIDCNRNRYSVNIPVFYLFLFQYY